jgi:hypothetical protein
MFTQHSQPIIDLQQDDMMTGGLIILRQILHFNASSLGFLATGTLNLYQNLYSTLLPKLNTCNINY